MKRIVFLLLFWVTCALAQPADKPAEGGEQAKAAPSDNTQVVVEKKADEAQPKVASSGNDAYQLKVKDLERRVGELKEKIYYTKTRLAHLKESILSTTIAGAEARLVHRNEMGSSFTLEKVVYSLDGTPIFNRIDTEGDLDGEKEIEIFDGPIVPGNHTVSVVMVYRGNGFGVFSYLRGYVFTLRSSHTFTAEEGKRISVRVIGLEKGGITTDLKDRPDIKFESQASEPGTGTRDEVVND